MLLPPIPPATRQPDTAASHHSNETVAMDTDDDTHDTPQHSSRCHVRGRVVRQQVRQLERPDSQCSVVDDPDAFVLNSLTLPHTVTRCDTL